jgi:hypothetical protein
LRLFLCGGFDCFAAAGVEIEEVGDWVFSLGGGGGGEAGDRSAAGLGDVGVRGYELEEIESDVFGTAGGEVGALIHGMRIAKDREEGDRG